jgi:hypothetical protein
MEPIVVTAPEGSWWRSRRAAPWFWFVVVLDPATNEIISDPETALTLFPAWHARYLASANASRAPS